MGRTKTATAKTEGLAVLDDADLRKIVDGRTAQLEAELFGHRMLLDEQLADPHVEDDADSVKDTRTTIESLEARLQVLAERREALGEAPSSDEG